MAELADGLPDAASQLARFLDHQLADGRVAAARGATHAAAAAAAAVHTAQDALIQVQTAAQHLALLLTRAEAAMLALTPTADDPRTKPTG